MKTREELAERHLDRRYPPPGHPDYREPDISADEWREAYFVLAAIAQKKLDECYADGLDDRDERERDIAFRAAKMSRTPPEDIRAAIKALRGPMDRNEAIAIGCAYAVLWAHEEVARLSEMP